MEKEWPEIVKKKADKNEKGRLLQPFIDAMDDDFNTAFAVGHIFQELHKANRLMDEAGETGNSSALIPYLPALYELFKEAGSVLGVFNKPLEDYFDAKKKYIKISEDEIKRLINERNSARKSKNWKRADEIRKELEG